MALNDRIWTARSYTFWVVVVSLAAAFIFTTSFYGIRTSAGTGDLYVNGPLATGATTNSGVAAPAGTQWSEAANDSPITANTLAGVSCSVTTTVFRCADDFTVPEGETWSLEQVKVYAYQTGFTGTTSPINQATLQIWNGIPGGAGSTVIFGDTSTDRLVSSTDSTFWRIFSSVVGAGNSPPTTPATNRRVWETVIAADIDLPTGTYWIDWNTRVGTTSAHFAPPVTIPGTRGRPGDNARQFTAAGWQDVVDNGQTPTGNPTPAVVPQDFPFRLVGTSSGGGTPVAVKNDFDGDGESDFAITRVPAAAGIAVSNNDVSAVRGAFLKYPGTEQLGSGPGTAREWWISNSGDNSFSSAGLGTGALGELYVPTDFDGDLKADIAVWRADGGVGSFHILNSATSTVSTVEFGITGDNPTIVGDYDGDGLSDPAVFRCPSFPPGGQCHYYYMGSDNNPGNNITFVAWGDNVPSDLFPNRGDFDGDGRLDFCVQRVRPGAPGQGQFVLLRSSDQGVEFVDWDTSSALIVPGDYDGDGMSDFMTVRVISGTLQWALQTRSGSQSFTNWGTTNVTGTNEFIAQSDYDGDGATDITVYRRDNTDPDNSYYYVLRSSDGTLEAFEWGAPADVPINGWDVN